MVDPPEPRPSDGTLASEAPVSPPEAVQDGKPPTEMDRDAAVLPSGPANPNPGLTGDPVESPTPLPRPEDPDDEGATISEPVVHELTPDSLVAVRARVEAARERIKVADDLFPRTGPSDWWMRHFERQGALLVQREDSPLASLWFVGDLHGDLTGLHLALEAVRSRLGGRTDGEEGIVLLGDLIDDLAEGEHILREVARSLAEDPRIALLPGNHDLGLVHDPHGGFRSTVRPAEFCESLQSSDESPVPAARLELARSFVDSLADAPVALVLRDGTIAAHGGVPHVDRLDAMSDPGWLTTPGVIDDFVWSRFAPRAKRRMAVSGTRSRELGAEDFHDFRRRFGAMLGFPVRRMVRGHDHHDERFEILGGHWRRRVITINGMTWRLPREPGPDSHRSPAMVHWQPNRALEVVRLSFDPDWRREIQTGSPA